MSDVGKSLIQGAMKALEYAKGQKNGHKTHKVNVPAQVDVAEIRKNYI
ncbi:hypothetical protein [Legionella brunensis]|nr:hypothetical protein [Legionella brunensis]